jgi:hypothetical protein
LKLASKEPEHECGELPEHCPACPAFTDDACDLIKRALLHGVRLYILAIMRQIDLRGCAVRKKMTVCLRSDIGVGPFASPETLIGVTSHLGNQLWSERDPIALIELSEVDLQHAAKQRELTLPLVEQLHRFADHRVRIGELTAGSLFPNQGFDVGGKLQCHRTTFSALAASASITLR